MTHVLLLNLVFFIPATSGAATFAFLIHRFVVRSDDPPEEEGQGPGGAKALGPSVGPDDLARSA